MPNNQALSNQTFIQAFRQSSPYINAHRKKTVVISLDSAVLQSPLLTRIIYDISLLNSLGIKIIVVLSTRDIIASELEKQNIESQYHHGRRITTEDILAIAQQISGKYRYDLEAKFSNALPNTPMHGANIRAVSGNFIAAKPLGIIDGIDFQFSASVRKIDAAAMQAIIDNDAILLLSNIAYTATGECFNVRAEEVAIETAKAMQADKFIIYASAEQLTDLPREMLLEQAEALLKKQDNHNLAYLADAHKAGVKRCHMINFEHDGSLISELFTTDGSGVLLSNNPFESIRQAQSSDIISIMHLLEPLERNGQLIARDRDMLEQDINKFAVIERDQRIIACAALMPYENMAEIACVATDSDYQGGNRASQIMQFLEKSAKAQGFDKVFVLTTQSQHFFLNQGYLPVKTSDLPEIKQSSLDSQRSSQALIKQL